MADTTDARCAARTLWCELNQALPDGIGALNDGDTFVLGDGEMAGTHTKERTFQTVKIVAGAKRWTVRMDSMIHWAVSDDTTGELSAALRRLAAQQNQRRWEARHNRP